MTVGFEVKEAIFPSIVFIPAIKRKQSPLDYLLWRAKRQWREWFP